jgi:alanyl-tRNA synthetase
VAQKGSLVNADYLRFDFSHFAKMSDEEISQVENIVNEKIRENVPVIIKELPKEEALKLGAMALFGEKYGDVVRVVIMDAAYSVELCGGTHVGYTGQIGYFKLMSEAAVAAGVRRVEALAGAKAISYLEKQASQLEEVKELLRQPKDIAKTIKSLQDENTLLKKEVEQYQLEKADQLKQYVKSKIVQSNGFSFAIQSLQGITADGLKKIAFELRQECNDLILVLTANIHDKPFIAVAIADSLVASKNLNAGKVVKTLAAHINGGGGGQPFYATAGGTDLAGINAAISEANSWINTI